MKTHSRIRLGVASSIAVSIVIAVVAFGILRDTNAEVRRMEALSEIADKTRALHILTASFKEGSARSDIRQVKEMLLSLDGPLKNMSARTQREEVLIEQLRKSYNELGPLIDEWFASGRATSGVERERRDILSSQIWMKAQFVSDDTKRLKDISQSRIIAARQRAGVSVIVLIVLLAGANGAIYVLSVRGVMRAQRALLESEQRLRLAQEAAGLGIHDYDVIAGILRWDRRVREIWGFGPDEPVTYQMFISGLHPDDRAPTQAAVDRALDPAGDGRYYAEYRVVNRADSRTRWVAAAGQVSFEKGRAVRLVGTVEDITGQKEAEETLRANERRLRLAQEIARVGTFDWNIVTGENIWTPELEAMYGLPAGGFAKTQPAWESLVHPEDRAATMRKVESAFETGRPAEGEWRVVWPDGSVHWLAGRWQVFKDASGRPVRMTGVNIDITEGKRAEEALKESEERFRKLAMFAPIGIFLTDEKGDSLFVNRKWSELAGLPPEQAQGRGWSRALHPEDRMRVFGAWYEAVKAGREFTMEYRFQRPDGHVSWVYDNAVALRDAQGAVTGYLGTVFDITERKRMEETITHQAHHDLLTGLPNRMLFTEHLEFALSQAHRHHRQVAVMFLDLDRFKTINDTLGHTVGDELLKEIAHRITPFLRETDTIARIGGDEFTVLLSQIAHLKDISRIADKILAAFEPPFTIGEHTFHMTTSVGVSVYPEDGADAETLIKNADIAMYHAKEQGRNSYQFYSPALNIRTLERMILENSLRQTLKRGELELFYQPQFDIATGRMVCAEALIRWRHPELGVLNPMQFIPLAEEIGFIVSIDEWVLRTACSQNKAWQDAGYAPFCVTVNLSSRQFKQPGLVEAVSRILDETGLDPRWLELEVTETIAMEDIEHTIPSVRRLAEAGIHFSIDDFGTGYSSLSYLKRLPIQKLKIDKSFVRDIATDADDRAIVAAIVSLAHSMDLRVVAEGVETPEQLALLQASSCDEVQGYVGSHPLPTEKYEHFIKTDGHLTVG